MSFVGMHHTPETLEKMRQAKLGKKPSAKTIAVLRAQHEAHRGKPAWNRGVSPSQETLAKMSESQKGKAMPDSFREKCRQRMLGNTIARGRRHSEETKRKIRAAAPRGPKCHLWRGGVSFAPYGPGFNRELKRIVRERDGYKCAMCGLPGRDCHHIDYDKHNNDPSNLVTLCHVCHSMTNQNRAAWVAFFAKRAA